MERSDSFRYYQLYIPTKANRNVAKIGTNIDHVMLRLHVVTSIAGCQQRLRRSRRQINYLSRGIV